MYKNWPAICEIENALLRMLVATSEDESVNAKLAAGFPELYSDTKTKPKIPFSALKTKARESLADEENCVMMDEVLTPFGLPSVNIGYNADEGFPKHVPPDMIAVVREIYDVRLGYDILIADNQPDPSPRLVDMLGEQYWIAEICGFDSADGSVDELTLVPAILIDFAK